ncbi:MAG: hypothetical protein HYY44_05060 [Deltaproteobacteria bacterium]|nr:hypothetical protein [Deltaproteobacteria bacterium]
MDVHQIWDIVKNDLSDLKEKILMLLEK